MKPLFAFVFILIFSSPGTAASTCGIRVTPYEFEKSFYPTLQLLVGDRVVQSEWGYRCKDRANCSWRLELAFSNTLSMWSKLLDSGLCANAPAPQNYCDIVLTNDSGFLYGLTYNNSPLLYANKSLDNVTDVMKKLVRRGICLDRNKKDSQPEPAGLDEDESAEEKVDFAVKPEVVENKDPKKVEPDRFD